jgi:hypothetical protein
LITEVTAPGFINVEDEPARYNLDSPGQVRVPCHDSIWIYGDPLRIHWGSGYRLDRSGVGDTMPQRVDRNRDSAVISEVISKLRVCDGVHGCMSFLYHGLNPSRDLWGEDGWPPRQQVFLGSTMVLAPDDCRVDAPKESPVRSKCES